MSLVITTPTGHIGSETVRFLLDAGRTDLVLLVRDASKLPADVRDRVETREGVLQDAAFVREATAGADALLWISPADVTTPDMYGWYDALGASVAGAVRANGIGHVVHLSSDGAQKRSGHGPVSGVGRVEAALDLTGAAVRHLRPTFFMENFEHQLGPIASAGAVFFSQPPDTSTGMIATRDIAAAAADLLLDLSWTGTDIATLLGPRHYTYADAAAILADGLGRDVRMQQVPSEAIVQQYTGMGATAEWAQGFVDLFTNIGLPGYADTPRSAASTTPTTLETYVADTLRPMLDAMPAPAEA